MVLVSVTVLLTLSAAITLSGHDWGLAIAVITWPAFMIWVGRFKCAACRERFLAESDGLFFHPRWMPAKCRHCGKPTDRN